MYFFCVLIIFCNNLHLSIQLEHNCYFSKNGNLWKLVSADEFDGSKVNINDWEVTHETEKCNGNWIEQESCNHRDNIVQSAGYLQLHAKYQKYLNFNYTSATITSRFAFTYGRIEVRASVPIGRQLRTSIFTINSNDTQWHDNGQIVISTQKDNIDRRVFFAGSQRAEDAYGITEWQSQFTENMNDFHLYGFEWSREKLKFFFDDNYSVPFRFNETATLSAWHKIRFQIGIGLAIFKLPLPENFHQLNWKCPNFLIDYIRVYQQVESTEGLHECQKEIILKRVEDQSIQRICRNTMTNMTIPENWEIKSANWNWPIFLGIGMLILFIILVGYILLQLKQVQSKVEAESAKLEENLKKQEKNSLWGTEEDMYESIFDTGNFYEIEDWNREIAAK